MSLELLFSIMTPLMIPVIRQVKKVVPEPIIGWLPIILAVGAEGLASFLGYGDLQTALIYGISSGSISSKVFDLTKPLMKKLHLG